MDVFLACPISMDILEVEQFKAEVENTLSDVDGLNVVSSTAYFERSFHEAGSWSNWIEQVAEGRQYGGRKDIFQVYVLPSLVVGRATAQILEKALARRKPVMHCANGMLQRVRRVETVDSENWQAGWRLTFAQ